MLDFDKARSFELDDRDVIDKLKAATMGNDPYFPDPLADDADDRELWNVFKDVYLKTAKVILKHRGASEDAKKLPDRFIEAWVKQAKENKEEGDGVEFGF